MYFYRYDPLLLQEFKMDFQEQPSARIQSTEKHTSILTLNQKDLLIFLNTLESHFLTNIQKTSMNLS